MSVPHGQPRLTPADILARDTKSLATSLELAKSLFTTEGYTLHVRHEAGPGRFFVQRPAPLLDRRTGELTEGYDVDIVAGTCGCPLFVRLAERSHLPGRECLRPSCKHLAATQLEFARAYNLIAPFLAVDLAPLIETWKRAAPTPTTTTPTTTPTFATAPNPAPAPVRRSGRGIPVCKRCMVQMSPSVREGTGQDGHLCPICADFLPLGSLAPLAPLLPAGMSLTTH